MELTPEILQAFKGGQFSVTNARQRIAYHGQIKEIRQIQRRGSLMLEIVPEWMAISEHFPPRDTGWRTFIAITYRANPLLYTAEEDHDGRIKLESDFTGETTILYPRGQVVIRRSDVTGP